MRVCLCKVIGEVTLIPDHATIGDDGAPLFTGKEVTVGLSGFLA